MNENDILLLEMDEAFDLSGGKAGKRAGKVRSDPTRFLVKKVV
jgi:hypothetical protein